MRLASLLQKPVRGPTAMNAREVFEMATIEGAKALGLENEVGSLEIGKKADMAAVNLSLPSVCIEPSEKNPEQVYSALVYSCSPADVTETWVEGRSVYRRGSYPGVKVEEIVNQAMKERKKLLARI
jgi:cytosine/adenosine deaminase-related metal-dependent hydrolase